MRHLALTGEAAVALSADRSTVTVSEDPNLYGEDAESVAVPVATAFRIADLLLREFPHEFPGKGA